MSEITRTRQQATRGATATLRRPRATIAALAVLAAAGSSLALALAGCGASGPAKVDTAGKVAFDTALRLPPIATTHPGPDGEKTIDLDARSGTSHLVGDTSTPTLGFADPHGAEPRNAYLGPTIVADRGDRVHVNVTDELDETTTVHWHGMHLPAAMDGGPHQPIAPGATRSPHWRIAQPAATLWYHPHPHGETEHQVADGMAGMVILHDDIERRLPLPHDYGIDDIPVIVQDARFTTSGRFSTAQRGYIGALGDTVLVNGTVGPYLDVATQAVRLRLLNASPARIYDFGFADARSFQLIGTDGGLLSAPATMTRVRLSPGERAEIVVRMEPGQTATLRSTPPNLGALGPVASGNGGSDTLDVLQLRAAAALRPSPRVPGVLAPIQRIHEADATVTRRFGLDSHQINGAKMQLDRIDFAVTVGTTEEWIVRNDMGEPHTFHVHDVQFQVVDVDGKAPPPELSGWKDTVYVAPNTEISLLVRFSDYTDPDLPYMYHCHLLEHEDDGMMGQFVVVGPGQKAGTPPPLPSTTGDGSGPREEGAHDHEH